jgi:hypothetical protein
MSTFASVRLAELPAFFNDEEGRAWARGMGKVQDAQLQRARVAALSRLPLLCPDDALDLVGQWLLLPPNDGETNGTAVPPTGYRGRLCAAFATWAIAGSVGAIEQALHEYGVPDVDITGDVHWESSYYSRFRVTLGPNFGDFPWDPSDLPTAQQKRDIRNLILRWRWSYSYPVDVHFDFSPDPDEVFFIGPLVDHGFIVDVNTVGGFATIP